MPILRGTLSRRWMTSASGRPETPKVVGPCPGLPAVLVHAELLPSHCNVKTLKYEQKVCCSMTAALALHCEGSEMISRYVPIPA